MTRDEIITFAGEIARSLQDADTLDVFTNDVFDDLATRSAPGMIEAKIKALTSGVATYDFEPDMIRIVYAIMEDALLSPETEPNLDAYAATWEADSGTPVAITQDHETARTYRLYPNPDFTSDPLIPIHGEPWGEDWPENSLALIYADNREDNIADIYAIPVAFDALAREFAYPSNHIDSAFSATCKALSQLFYRFIGVV